MMGDSLGSADDLSKIRRADKKVFIRNGMLLGVAGSYRMRDVIRYVMPNIEPLKEGQDLTEYIVTEYISTLRAVLKEVGYEIKEFDAYILIGFMGELFVVEEDFQVGTFFNDFYSIGSGSDFAMGAMGVSSKKNPKKFLNDAIAVSAKYCTAVEKPFTYRKMKW